MLCGFCVRAAQRSVLRLYIVLVAVSLATVIYGVIVFVMEQIGPPQATGPTFIIYVFLAVAGAIGAVAIGGVAPLVRKQPGSAAVFRSLIIQTALAESIAIMGLVLYFVLGSVQWFTIFLGISWVVFTIIGIRLGDDVAEYERRLVGELDER